MLFIHCVNLHLHLHCHSSIHSRHANRQAGTLANCHKPEEHRSLVKRRRFVSLARKERKKKKKNQTKPWLRYFHEGGEGERGRGTMCGCTLHLCLLTYEPRLLPARQWWNRPSKRKKRARRRSQGWRIKGKWIKDKHIMLMKERVYVFPEDWPIGKAKWRDWNCWIVENNGGGGEGGGAVFDEQDEEPWYALFFQIFAR